MNKKTVFICYPKCSTCKKCEQALKELDIDYSVRNIKEENPTKEELKSWLEKGVPLKQLFNTSGMLYRELNVKEKRKTYSEDQLLDLLATDGMLVKRPIVIQGDTVLVGNRIAEYEQLK
ncbi:MAG: Spx/MgsR family RNA polymerase-binding regulatory protein [Erysipelotrichaceae bacterium]|nr:Spx/MgsR family RNA polymerase-binding regulatory protein [Erysipelotrichaceae bacterium]